LLVDHTFVYTPAVRKIRDLISSGALGEIYYYDAVRVNLGLFQHDVNVIWDLAIHDLSIMDCVLPEKPVAISATGISHVPGQPENVAYITLFFPSTQIAHVHVNWLTPVKVRHTLIGGSEKMILYDDLEPSEKLKVYDKGINVTPEPEDVYKMLVSYRLGDMWAPQLDNTEALQTEARHFVECIETNKQPETDGAAGLRMVNMIEAAETSLRDRGRLVEIQW
jgi:predicted dehydrogenase